MVVSLRSLRKKAQTRWASPQGYKYFKSGRLDKDLEIPTKQHDAGRYSEQKPHAFVDYVASKEPIYEDYYVAARHRLRSVSNVTVSVPNKYDYFLAQRYKGTMSEG